MRGMDTPCRTLIRLALLCGVALLQGCALSWIRHADPQEASTPEFTVVAGRMNYIIDGQPMAPYGSAPRWGPPNLIALRMEDGNPYVFPQVDEATGAFRLRVPPGAYVVSQIGPPMWPDRNVGWPRIVLCVPATSGEPVRAGHLQLLGSRYRETYTLSTGSERVSQGIRYRYAVTDEGGPGVASLFREVPDMPIGQNLVERWQRDKTDLIRLICG
jgi:hypothetical protein